MKVSAIIGPMPKDAEFIDAVGQALEIAIPVVDEMPTDGYVIATRAQPLDPALAPRVLWIGADRNRVMEWMEEFGFAGAVVNYRYMMWLNRSTGGEPTWGVIGRKDVAPEIDATLLERPFLPTARYGLFDSKRYPDLPTWVAAYLIAYDKMNRP